MILPPGLPREQVAPVRDVRLVGASQVRRAADHAGQRTGRPLQRPARVVARRRGRGAGQVRQRVLPAVRQLSRARSLEVGCQRREGVAVGVQTPLPLRLRRGPRRDLAPPVLQRVGVDMERIQRRVADVALGGRDLVVAERGAVRVRRSRHVGAALGDGGAEHDQRRAGGLGARSGQRAVDCGQVRAVPDRERVPAVSRKAAALVGRRGQVGRALDRDPVVVEDPNQLAEPLVARDLGRLVGDALHEVAVRAQRVRVVIHDVVAGPVVAPGEPPLRERHPHRVGDALSQRARGGLDPGRVTELGVAGRPAAPLPELSDVVQRHPVARQVQNTVQEHGGVAGRQHKAVAVEPRRVGGVVAQVPGPERVSEGRERHRRPRVSRTCGLHRVHGERLHRVDRELHRLPTPAACATTKFRSRSLM